MISMPLHPFRHWHSRRRHDGGGRPRSLPTIAINALFVGSPLLPGSAAAVSPEQFVLGLNRSLRGELGSADSDEAERRDRLAGLLDAYVDLGAASALMLGTRWTDASPQDRAQFRAVFRDYLVRSFATRLHGVGDQRLRITGLTLDGGTVTVGSEVLGSPSAPLTVDWRLEREDDALWRLSNVTIAGISMAAVMSAQLDAMRDQDDNTGLASLVRLLRDQQRSR